MVVFGSWKFRAMLFLIGALVYQYSCMTPISDNI